jgi:hypothetical protein
VPLQSLIFTGILLDVITTNSYYRLFIKVSNLEGENALRNGALLPELLNDKVCLASLGSRSHTENTICIETIEIP